MVYRSWQKELKSWLKSNPGKDETDFADLLLVAVEAESRYRQQRKESRQFLPDWCNGTTWINQQRWTAEFVDIPVSRLKEQEDRVCPCGEPIIGQLFTLCSLCYSKKHGALMPELREAYKKIKTTGTVQEMVAEYNRIRGSLR